ncbi:rhomboid family intramembrane serine protease GlpG [Thalassotalea sp. PP2-459]|uniref:rhomboid family intramembrane serine protease GlpG n=1 Tax=Thalassotalea sp. PP2-459 TaxID=1742724 RepID=UPI0009429EA2|nr:rhomboid family intramembrane serine protease GlpG [Thalassotalea sp. PP2-459]OKY26652.1 rhomboid family intramembrane serine protease GlpG [Thalassotalea sp. PP2-459]
MSDIQLSPLAVVKEHSIALLFANYLRAQQISSDVRPHEGEFVVLCDQQLVEQAKDYFQEFVQNPYAEKYQQAAWQSGEAVHVEKSALTASFKQQFLSHAGLVTLVIFVLCWLVFIASALGWKQSLFFELRFFTQLSLANLVSEPWRLVGAAFFHFSLLHIVFNTMWWWQLGGAIEKMMGKTELLNVFFVSAILSNFGQYIVSGPNFGGLSGVVYAVFGYVWIAGWLAPEKGLHLAKPIIGFMLFFLLLGFADLLPINVANTAHTVGLLSGCFLAWMRFGKWSRR